METLTRPESVYLSSIVCSCSVFHNLPPSARQIIIFQSLLTPGLRRSRSKGPIEQFESVDH